LVEITPDKQHEFAAVAQAEGVSLSVARQLLRVVAGSNSTPSVATLGRATSEEIIGVDYIVAPDGARHLLEVNHVPNVTAFPEVREAYLDLVVAWANRGVAELSQGNPA
jgi:hypothetical protein